MFVTPWFCSDRDGEMVHGEKLIAMTAPNVAIADRRLNIPVSCTTSERFMIVSIARAVALNADYDRWFCGFSSVAIELSMS
jgi:hypothetical protein